MRDAELCCDDWCAKDQAAKVGVDEVILKDVEEKKKKDQARKKLVTALEDAGVDLPVTAFETMVNNGEKTKKDIDDDASDVGLNPLQEDEFEGVPDDLKAILRRSAQAKRDREIFGIDPEGAMKAHELHSGSVADTDEESRPDSMRSWHSSMFGDDDSKAGSVLYPNAKNRRVQMAIAFCCVLQLALAGLLTLFVMRRKDDSASLSSTENVTDTEGDNVTSIGSGPTLFGNVTAYPSAAPVTPTLAPTKSPTKSPSAEPTETPEVCESTIITNARCYARGQQIVVMFENCDPQTDDWVGIYDASISPQQLVGDGLDWMWACGNKECAGLVNSNIVAFTDTFQAGTYRAHLIRREGEFAAYASSESFEIKAILLDC